MILLRFVICVGGRVVKLESKAHDLLMKDICLPLGGCFIGMMGTKEVNMDTIFIGDIDEIPMPENW
jgi:hypothetical protein